MRYDRVCRGTFLSRPNRFIAYVEMEGRVEVCHVKNTGRCRELLLPGAVVVLAAADRSARKTAYDLIAVYKGARLINMDSQAPNKVAAAYIPSLFPNAAVIRPEYRYGDSRLDFYVETAVGERILMEVKGVTLEEGGLALFPDAPTERGVKHLHELTAAVNAGYTTYLLFVVQMQGIHAVAPNDRTHPAFGEALRQAAEAGVRVLAVDCLVTEESLTPGQPLPVLL